MLMSCNSVVHWPWKQEKEWQEDVYDIIRHPATLLYTYTTHCCIEKLLSVPPPAPVSKICQQIGCSCDWFSHFFSCMKGFSGVTLTMSRPSDQHLTFDPLLPSDWGQNVTTHYWHFPGISALNFASISVTRMTVEKIVERFPVNINLMYQYIPLGGPEY